MKAPPLIVEFTGARGVGKSTLAGLVRAELTRRHIPFVVGTKRGRHYNPALEFAYALARMKLEQQCRSWGVNSPEALRVYRQRFRNYQFQTARRSREAEILMLDEGVFQLMMMISIRSGQEIEPISRMLSQLVSMPDLVISVEATEEEIESRRRRRGNAGDLLKPTVSQRSREGLKRMQEYIRSLSSDVAPRGLVVNNQASSNPDDVRNRLVDEIVSASVGCSFKLMSQGKNGRVRARKPR